MKSQACLVLKFSTDLNVLYSVSSKHLQDPSKRRTMPLLPLDPPNLVALCLRNAKAMDSDTLLGGVIYNSHRGSWFRHSSKSPGISGHVRNTRHAHWSSCTTPRQVSRQHRTRARVCQATCNPSVAV